MKQSFLVSVFFFVVALAVIPADDTIPFIPDDPIPAGPFPHRAVVCHFQQQLLNERIVLVFC